MPPPDEVARRCERADAEAWASLLEAAPPAIARVLGLGVRRIGPAVAGCASGLDILMYNRVVALGLDAPAAPADLDAALEFYRRAGTARCMVQVSPAMQPAAATAWLEQRGFYPHNRWVKLWRDASPPDVARTDLRLGPVGADRAAELAGIVIANMGHPESLVPWLAGVVGRPGWHCFGAFEDEALVATAALFAQEGVGWLGLASTRPSHRGRGAQSALIAHRIRAAARLGCSFLVAETAEDKPEKPNPSTHNLVRLGFQVAYLRPNWVRVLTGS
jgi:GNAT superfamily N-acetyltransferase